MTALLNRRTFSLAAAIAPFSGITACAAIAPSAATSQTPLNWTPLADMPFPVQEIYPAAFEIDGREVIINAGGLTPWDNASFNVTDLVTIYDTTENNWRFGAPLPEPRHHIGLVAVGNAMFGVSGFARDDVGGWQMQTNLWRSDNIDRGPWEAMRPLPVPQSEPVIMVVDDKIHVIGGRTPAGERNLEWNDQTDTDRHWIYDPESDQWVERAPLPMARNLSLIHI